MNSAEVLVGIVYYFTESLVLCLASFIYVGISAPKKRILLFGIIFGLATFLLRDVMSGFYIPDGSHSIILFFFNMFLIKVIFGFSFLSALICDFLYFITITIVETLEFLILILIGIPSSVIFSSILYLKIYGFINLFIICSIIYFLHIKKITIISMKKIIRDSSSNA